MTSSSTEPSGIPVTPRVATFFALYPDPLGLDDGAYLCALQETHLQGFPSRIALHLKEGEPPTYLDPSTHEFLFVSIRFHRGIRQESIFAEHVDQLIQIVGRIGGPHFRDSVSRNPVADVTSAGESMPDGREYTVVEMTTPIVRPQGSHWEPSLPEEDLMGPTLTRCLLELMRTITAYRAAENILLPSPARERVGPIIIAATRPANPDDGGWDPDVRTVINAYAVYRQPMVRGGHKPTTMSAMAEYVFLEQVGHPTLALGSLQNEMDVAFYHEGNFRGAVMSAHSASEVLLDVALMGMLFEDGKAPDEAARIFDKPLKTRLLSEFPGRLGGAWDPKGSNTVRAWIHDLLALRHRVAHAGYMPSQEEAEAAREAYYALGRHLRDRLTLRAKTYPFTAGVLVTRAGFERRNVRTKAANKAVEAAGADALIAFAAWRTDVMRLRIGNP